MSENQFRRKVERYLETVELYTGLRLDERLSGISVARAVEINIAPALAAIVRTEHLIDERLKIDLRELVDAKPPVEAENLFITFSASSADFQGGNVDNFGIHMTRQEPEAAVRSALQAGVFVPGAQVEQIYQMVIFVEQPDREIGIARTGVAVGMDELGRLVAYLTFETNKGLRASVDNPPSSARQSDRQVLLYVFLALAAFLAANQGEAPLQRTNDSSVIIG